MIKIRMSRGGAKKRPIYKIVIADSRKPRDGRFIEKVGFFNPLLPKDKKERLSLDIERIKYWLEKGARPSDRIARFLGEANVIPKPAQRNNPIKAKPKKKAQERLAAAEEVKKAAVFLDNKLSEVKEASGLDEKRAAIITALNISNEYLKNLSNVSRDDSVNQGLDNLTIEVKKQLKSLSFKAR